MPTKTKKSKKTATNARLNKKLAMQEQLSRARKKSRINVYELENEYRRKTHRYGKPEPYDWFRDEGHDYSPATAAASIGLQIADAYNNKRRADFLEGQMGTKYYLTPREVKTVAARKYGRLLSEYDTRILKRKRKGARTRFGKLGKKYHGGHEARLVKKRPKRRKQFLASSKRYAESFDRY